MAKHTLSDHTGLPGVVSDFADVATDHDAHDHTGVPGVGGGAGSSLANLYVGTAPIWVTANDAAAPTADRVAIVRFRPDADITVDTVHFQVITASGNCDIGIYNEALSSKLGSTGSFVCPAAGARSQALTAPVALTGGTIYYAAMVCSSNTARIRTVTASARIGSPWNQLGRLESSPIPLPASITPTAWEDTGYLPVLHFGA